MLTTQLAQNLVAIGLADFICRMNRVAYHCCLNPPKSDCCREHELDTLNECLLALGKDPWTT